MSTKNAKPATIETETLTVGQAESRFGTAQPQIEVRVPKGTSHRRLHAALHRLAAEVELATPAREKWCVEVDATSDERGRVYLDLLNGDAAETARGLAVLRAVVAR